MTPGVASGRGLAGRAPRFGLADVAVLAAIALCGLVQLPTPFEWDQAMFVTGARAMHDGAVLYRDVWDLKPPAIYVFYTAAGSLFGFSETGIHLFELLWWLAFSAVLLTTLRGAFANAWVARLAPLLTVGVYYAAIGPWHSTQVEGLVAFPMYLALWWARPAPPREPGGAPGPVPAGRMFLSGLAGGVVLLFKLVFAPILAAFWLVALVRARRAGGSLTTLGGALAAAALGVALPVGGTVAFYAAQGLWGQVVWLMWGVPATMMAKLHGTRLGTLFDGLSWSSTHFGSLAALAVAGLGPWRARRDGPWLELWLWTGLGLLVILAQHFSWWQYHYLLLVTPLGLLAAAGVDGIWSALPESGRRVAVAALVVLLSTSLVSLASKTVLLARARFALGPRRMEQYTRSVSQLYDRGLDEVGFMRAGPQGTLFVVGNPVYYPLTGRRPARADAVGIFFDWLPRERWATLARDLGNARPAYVYVESAYDTLFEGQGASGAPLARLLARDYDGPRRGALGRSWVIHGADTTRAR